MWSAVLRSAGSSSQLTEVVSMGWQTKCFPSSSERWCILMTFRLLGFKWVAVAVQLYLRSLSLLTQKMREPNLTSHNCPERGGGWGPRAVLPTAMGQTAVWAACSINFANAAKRGKPLTPPVSWSSKMTLVFSNEPDLNSRVSTSLIKTNGKQCFIQYTFWLFQG